MSFISNLKQKLDKRMLVWQQLVVVGLLLLLVAITSWPLAHPELFRVHDYVHAARISELTLAAAAGHMPVRWTQNFGFGYGMPLFEFYAPLPYYVGGLLFWLTKNLLFATKFIFFLPNLAAVVGSFLLGKILYGKKGGLLVAAAYSLAPYRAVNLYVRGAIGESWGMAVMPIILWAGILFIRKSKNTQFFKNVAAWWTLVGWLCALLLSHNLSTLMFVPISLIVFTAVLLQEFKVSTAALKTGLQLLAGYGLAIGLSSFYIFPAVLEKDFTIIGSILSGYFHYSHHFLYIRQFFVDNWAYGGSAWGPDDGISFFLGYGQLLALIVGALAVVVARKKVTTSKLLQHALFGLILGGSLFLTLLKSQFIWDTVPLLNFIQFPWRWLSIAILFLALLAGYGLSLVRKKKVSLLLLAGLFGILLINGRYFKPESFLERSEDFYYQDALLIRKQMSEILPDYIPIGMKLAALAKQDDIQEHDLLVANESAEVLYNFVTDSDKPVNILVNRPHQKLVSLYQISNDPVVFATAYFPGWKAEIDGNPAEVSMSGQGLLQLKVPKGEHQVGIFFGSTTVRRVSDAVSALSLLIASVLLVKAMPTQQTKMQDKNSKKKRPK